MALKWYRTISSNMHSTVLAILLPILITACYATPGLPSSTNSVLNYPGGHGAQVQNLSKSSVQTWQVLTFQTTDSSQAVLSFYEDNLLRDGWYSPSAISLRGNTLEMFCCGPSDQQSFFIISIVTQEVSTGLTKVKVELYEELPF